VEGQIRGKVVSQADAPVSALEKMGMMGATVEVVSRQVYLH